MHNVETWVFPLLIVLVGLTMLGRYLHGERESRRRPGGLTRFSDNVTSEGKPDFATHLSTTGLTPLETFSPASAYVGSSIFWERIDDPGFVGQAFRTRPTLRYVLRSVDAAAVAHLRWGYTGLSRRDAFAESAEGRWYFQKNWGFPAAILDPATARRIGVVQRRPIWTASLRMEDGKRYRLQTRVGLTKTFLTMHCDDETPTFISGSDGTVQILAASPGMSLLVDVRVVSPTSWHV